MLTSFPPSLFIERILAYRFICRFDLKLGSKQTNVWYCDMTNTYTRYQWSLCYTSFGLNKKVIRGTNYKEDDPKDQVSGDKWFCDFHS